MTRRAARKLGVFDFETDPFARGRTVRPFVWGFADDEGFEYGWNDSPSCATDFANFLKSLPDRYVLYAHNGGKFDFLFLLPHLAPNPTIINGRIVEARLGDHVLRDSYAILPVPLSEAGQKTAIDYGLFEAGRRRHHKAQIVEYLRDDCIELLGAVRAYRDRFGNALTMASAAIRKLKESVELAHGRPWQEVIHRQSPERDAALRPWFFGGRVECFERGIIKDALEIRDANSMYPAAMRNFQHPTGGVRIAQRTIDDRTDFVVIDCISRGALPLRAKDGSLSFPHGRHVFHANGHELRAGIELGLIEPLHVHEMWRYAIRTDFAPFVDTYYNLRLKCDAAGDDVGKLHFKLVLNSSYGRFALRADDLYEYEMAPLTNWHLREMTANGWELAFEGPQVAMFRRLAPEADRRRALLNVATGASITSASRAMLLRAIHRAERPLYCDTDSLICRSLDMPNRPGVLGDWKDEGRAELAAIAGKKLYALWGDAPRSPKEAKAREAWGDPRCVKLACKGVRLTAEQIHSVARGNEITWYADRPTFNAAGGVSFMHRRIRMTGDAAGESFEVRQ